MSKWIGSEQAEEYRQLEVLIEALVELLKQDRLDVLAPRGREDAEDDEPARIVKGARALVRSMSKDAGDPDHRPDPEGAALRPEESRRGARAKVVKIRRAALVPVGDEAAGVLAG